MSDFFHILQFLRIAAWARDGALANATVHACEHRRWPRGFDAPDFVWSAIGLGELCQRHLCRYAALMTPCSFMVKEDGTIEPLISRHGRG